MQSNVVSFLIDLPTELIYEISLHLNLKVILKLRLTCRFCKQALDRTRLLQFCRKIHKNVLNIDIGVLQRLYSIASTSKGNLVTVDFDNSNVHMLQHDTHKISLVCGSLARLQHPFGIAVDSMDRVLVSGGFNIKIVSGPVEHLAGQEIVKGFRNGPGKYSAFENLKGMCFDHNGNLLVCDKGTYTIRKIDKKGLVSVFAGTGRKKGREDGNVKNALLFKPWDIVADPLSDDIYFTDYKRVRVISKGIVRSVYEHRRWIGAITASKEGDFFIGANDGIFVLLRKWRYNAVFKLKTDIKFELVRALHWCKGYLYVSTKTGQSTCQLYKISLLNKHEKSL